MPLNGPSPISIDDAFNALTLLSDRTPRTTAEQSANAFSELSAYREGGIFVGKWSGASEWERHTAGDEIVFVIEGQTTISFLSGQREDVANLGAGQLVVVPQGVWHRFETETAVKVVSVTPQPTDHSVDLPV